MKNKILISILIVSFFNYIGCYSYNSITEEEIGDSGPDPYENITLILNDGSKVSCGSALISNSNKLVSTFPNEYYYLRIDKPSRILIGIGDKIDKNTRIRSSFEGIVQGDMIDSSRIFIVHSEEYYIYWTKDNKRLAFKKGDYIDILPEQGTGYFICKPYKLERVITFNDIKKIMEVKTNTDTQINWWILGPAIVLSVALVIGFIAFVKDWEKYHHF